MNRTIVALAGLLAVQLIVAAGLGFARSGLAGPAKEVPLVALTNHAVDRITIEGPGRAKVVLAQAKGAWQLPELGDFPADPARVKSLVDALGKLREGLPVATTHDALARFKVSDSDFERRVALSANGKPIGTVYFGTAPSMREIHARRDGQSDVYSVQFASWQMPVKASDWEDKTLLQIPVHDIAAIDAAGLHIVHTAEDAAKASDAKASDAKASDAKAGDAKAGDAKAGGAKAGGAKAPAWQATGLAGGETLDQSAAASLAGSLADLEFDHVITGTPPADDGLAAPALVLTVTKRGGASVAYRIGKSKDGKTYTLKSSERSEFFDVPSYAAEPLIAAASRDKLLGIKPAAAATVHPQASAPGSAKH
jgi:hypothetical protein